MNAAGRTLTLGEFREVTAHLGDNEPVKTGSDRLILAVEADITGCWICVEGEDD